MGLNIAAVSRGYKYSEKKGDMVGSEYDSTIIGYIGFKFFRDALVSFASDGDIKDAVEYQYLGKSLCWCFSNNDTNVVANDKKDFSEGDFEKYGEEINEYLRKLDWLDEKYPKLRAIYPFIAHSDCQGEIPLEQCRQILPILREFRAADGRHYGYSGHDYNFTDRLISVVESAVSHRGKLYFS